MYEDPPPPHTHTLIHHFGHAGLCIAQIKHIDQFQTSYYQLEHTRLCRAQDPKECKFTLCQIAVTWWIAGSCCNVLSSMAPVHKGTKTEVARISKEFRHRLANFGAWQGSRVYSESTRWPPLQAPLKEGLWFSDREDVEAHRGLLVRPVLNPAVEVSGGEVAKVNVGKGLESGEIWAYDGSVTSVPNEIKMLRYHPVIVEVPRRGRWIPGAHIVRVLSQGVLGAFHGHHGDLVAVEQHLRSQLEDLYPIVLRMAVYHLGRTEEPYLLEPSTLLLVKTHGLGPAVPHFLTQKSFTEGLWLGLAILWWLVNLLDPNEDTDDTHMDIDASRCMWALYYGRRPDLISLGYIHLPVPLNCAWGVLSDCPYNAADVVNLLKTSVRKGDTEEEVEWQSVMHCRPAAVPAVGVPLTRTVVSKKSRMCRIRKLPNQRGKPINNGRRSRRRLSASCGSKRRHRSGNVKRRRRRRRKRPKRLSEQIARGKKKRINWQWQPLRHPHRRKRMAVEGLQATLQRGVWVGLSKSNGKSNGK